MADEKLRQELYYMVQLASKYDLSNMDVVEGILRLENERQILESAFGKRFKGRIFDLATGVNKDDTCVICGQPADNHVICQHCMTTVGSSDYAKSKIKNKETEKPAESIQDNTSEKQERLKLSINIKKCLQIALICILLLLLVFQIWIFYIWMSIPSYNRKEAARNSSYELTPVNSVEEAYEQLVLDFPESENYTVTFARMDQDYVGRFLLNPGDCCLEVEEQLTDEQRYDYFFSEDVYVFYISYLEEHTSKVGMAEVNSAGAIIIQGSFNDGRRTDSFYKFR